MVHMKKMILSCLLLSQIISLQASFSSFIRRNKESLICTLIAGASLYALYKVYENYTQASSIECLVNAQLRLNGVNNGYRFIDQVYDGDCSKQDFINGIQNSKSLADRQIAPFTFWNSRAHSFPLVYFVFHLDHGIRDLNMHKKIVQERMECSELKGEAWFNFTTQCNTVIQDIDQALDRLISIRSAVVNTSEYRQDEIQYNLFVMAGEIERQRQEIIRNNLNILLQICRRY